MASLPADFDAPVERPLVSRTSILIVSAFLAGMVFDQALPQVVKIHASTAAAAGLVSFFGLWYSTRLRELREAQRTNAKVSRRLEKKLGKHLTTRRDIISGINRRLDLE
jgi:hypothetical protein